MALDRVLGFFVLVVERDILSRFFETTSREYSSADPMFQQLWIDPALGGNLMHIPQDARRPKNGRQRRGAAPVVQDQNDLYLNSSYRFYRKSVALKYHGVVHAGPGDFRGFKTVELDFFLTVRNDVLTSLNTPQRFFSIA